MAELCDFASTRMDEVGQGDQIDNGNVNQKCQWQSGERDWGCTKQPVVERVALDLSRSRVFERFDGVVARGRKRHSEAGGTDPDKRDGQIVREGR